MKKHLGRGEVGQGVYMGAVDLDTRLFNTCFSSAGSSLFNFPTFLLLVLLAELELWLLPKAAQTQLRVHYTRLVRAGEEMKRDQTARRFFGGSLNLVGVHLLRVCCQ